MDQKKILWIVAAAGVFLLVVFGAAAILYSPAAEPAKTIVTSAPNSAGQASGWVSPPVASQPPAPPSYQQNTAVSENETPTTGTLPTETHTNAELPSATQSQPSGMITQVGDMTVISQNTTVYGLQQHYPPAASTETTTIDLSNAQKPTSQAASNVTATNQAGATAISAAQNNSTAAKPAQPKSSTTVAKAPTTTTPKTAAASVRASETKTATTQYWVQAAAFTSKKSADNAVVVLDDNKIPANIFTYQDPKGTLYYRIRVGPYVTKSEAEYWQTRIAKIDTFSDTKSYVTTTTSNQ